MKQYSDMIRKYSGLIKWVLILVNIILFIIFYKLVLYPRIRSHVAFAHKVSFESMQWSLVSPVMYEKFLNGAGEQLLNIYSLENLNKMVITGLLATRFLNPYELILSGSDQIGVTETSTHYALITRAGLFNETIPHTPFRRIDSETLDISALYFLLSGPGPKNETVYCIREKVAQYKKECMSLNDAVEKKVGKKAVIAEVVWNKNVEREALIKASIDEKTFKYFTAHAWYEGVKDSTEDYFNKNKISASETNKLSKKDFTLSRFGPFYRIDGKGGVKYTFIPGAGQIKWVSPTNILILPKYFGTGYAVNLETLTYAPLKNRFEGKIRTAIE